MSPRRYRQRGYRASKRRFVWVRSGTGPFEDLPLGIPEGTLHWGFDLLPDANIDKGSVLGSTVTRVRGLLTFSQTGSTVDQLITYGVRVCDRSDISTPRWNPATDANDPGWMVWSREVLGYSGAINDLTNDYGSFLRVDGKSQRRIDSPSDTLGLFVLHQQHPGVGNSLRSAATFSTLLKLH